MTLNFDPVTLTYDLCHWTCVVDRLRQGRTLYKTSAKSNWRRSYCDLNIWHYDLEHVSRALLCCVIICTKFKLSQASVHEMWRFLHANTSCHTMTLTFDLESLWWHVVTVCTKFDRNRTIPGWVGVVSGSRIVALPRSEPRVYIWWASSAPRHRTVQCTFLSTFLKLQ